MPLTRGDLPLNSSEQLDLGQTFAGLPFVPSTIGATPTAIRKALEVIVFPEMFGAAGNGTADDTVAFSLARASGAKAIVLTAGKTYVVDQIMLRMEQSIVAAAGWGATIKKRTGNSNPLFVMPVGPVVRCLFEGLYLDGGGSDGHCFYLEAQPSVGSPFHGGLWYSKFKNVEIANFKGHSFWFRGGTGGGLLPHQFCDFDQVTAQREPGLLNSRAFLATGQVGQFTFRNCSLENRGQASTAGGCNIELSREFNNGGIVGGSLVGGSVVGTAAPYWFDFDMLTCQGGDYGIHIDTAKGVKIGAWLENLKRGITLVNAASARVIGTRFSNAGADADTSTGYCISATSSTLAHGQNFYAGTYDKMIAASAASIISLGGDTYSENIPTSKTTNNTRQFAQSGTNLNIGGSEYCIVNCFDATTSMTAIQSLEARVMPSRRTTIKAHNNGANAALVFVEGNNIVLPGSATRLVLRAEDALTFIFDDLSQKYVCTGTSIARLQAAVIPTTGYYEASEFVWNATPTISAGKILLGWSRLTTGVAHIAGTDWSPCYVTTT